jgi:mannonate dehydratase
MTALAGIDLALWDIKGKCARMLVYSLLGGKTREAALAYTHSGGVDTAEVEEQVRAAMAAGFNVIRAGGLARKRRHLWEGEGYPFTERWEPSSYLRTVPHLFEHLRVTVGEEIELLHDVHERLNPIQASRLLQELEPYHLFFLEDPLRPEHKESFRLLCQHSTTPIAMGELFTPRWDVLPLLTDQLIDFVRCDLGHIGGLTEARKIAAIAESFYIQTAWHGPGDIAPITHAANVHLDLAIPNFGVQEMVFFPKVARSVIRVGPAYKDGHLWLDDTPGLGTDVDENEAARYPYQRAYLPTVRRADGSVHDW